jgi:adenine deaminase
LVLFTFIPTDSAASGFCPTALTEVAIESVEVRNGRVNLETTPQLNYIAILNRHGRAERRTVALVENFHLAKGAVAGTVCHDSHNLALVYTNTADALRAAAEIKRIGGGLVYVNGDVVEFFALPVAG